MKKILFLGIFPPPYYGASILCEKFLDFLEESSKFDVRHIRLNYSKDMGDVGKINFDKIFGILKVRRQIISELKNFKPDLVYFAPATTSLGLIRDSYFASIIKKMNFPILFHLHSRITNEIRGKGMNERMLRKMLVDEKAIVLGKELVNDASWIIPKENITILSNAMENDVSEDHFIKIMKSRETKKGKVKIIFLSNMIKTKGWPKVLRACKILKEKGVSFECNFVGAWPSDVEGMEFNNYVKTNSLDKCVKSWGGKTGAVKNKFFESSDIFVFPTEYELETFGLVILEAMMHGLPVIANGIAAIPSIISKGETGFVLNDNTPEEIASFLEKLIKDKTLRIKMGQLGRERFLKHFEMKDYKEKLLETIERA